VLGGDRTTDHFGKHRSENEMILAADQNDLDFGRELTLEELREYHASESTPDYNYPSFAHD
jgi:hypothetical protein